VSQPPLRRGRPKVAQPKDKSLLIPMETRHMPLVKLAAQRDGRPQAGYVRHLVMQDMKAKGIIDENDNPLVDADGNPLAEAS